MRIEDGNRSDRIKRLRKKAMALPLKPGVYIMHDKSGKIIYVGKAVKLKNRVSQYFGSETNHGDKVRKMVSLVEDFEYIICDSEFEALILECSLIKQHMPKYNILLKDDKGYHYIKVTKRPWRTVKSAMQIDDDGAEYIGPYNSGWVVKQTVDEVQKIFKLPKCSKQFPRDIKKSRPCLNFYIGACSAPCAGKINLTEYENSVDEALEFIKGGTKLDIEQLREQMNAAAENLEFERAARLRDRISAVKRINEKQKVISCTYSRQDVIGVVQAKDKTCVEIFIFKNARLTDRKQYIVAFAEDLSAFRSEFIKQLYTSLEPEEIPPRILIDGECDDTELLERYFSSLRGKKVEIVQPKIGEQKQLMEMCLTNASEYLGEVTGHRGHDTAALDELAKLLGLSAPPEYIESYDISHTGGTENVAGMIVYKDGVPYKNGYRKFKIKSFAGQDDCRSMQEVVERRFTEYLNADDRDSGFGRLPDLILLDGGHTQLNAVKEVLDRLNINVPVFGMVKDGKHKTNAIATTGGTIAIKSNRAAFTLLYSIQEEVHRFAISYHRNRRNKKGLRSELLDIPSVGEATVTALLKHFKSVSAIKSATFEQLSQAKGVTKTAAKNVFEHFNKE